MDHWVVIMILGIVAISAFSRVQRAKYGDYGRRRRDSFAPQQLLDPALPSAREKELQKEVEDLRERIHVLERIATDGRHSNNLAAEIESLRDR
ncbi:MAG: hypothetical protein ACKOOL_02220 [Novosphingobium sp.]